MATILEFMANETSDLIDNIYQKENFDHPNHKSGDYQQIRKSPKAKYQVFDEAEFTRGREVLGNLIVQGMVSSGGTDVDWLVEHKGGFVILEFKGFHNDKINIPKGQMIAYETLHEKLNQATRCYLYIIGCDDIDFSDPDSTVWIFEMKQWKQKIIPKNTTDIFDNDSNRQNKFIIYREYMEEISVEDLRKIMDSHWKEFELMSGSK